MNWTAYPSLPYSSSPACLKGEYFPGHLTPPHRPPVIPSGRQWEEEEEGLPPTKLFTFLQGGEQWDFILVRTVVPGGDGLTRFPDMEEGGGSLTEGAACLLEETPGGLGRHGWRQVWAGRLAGGREKKAVVFQGGRSTCLPSCLLC